MSEHTVPGPAELEVPEPTPAQAELHVPHDIDCRYCGTVTVTDPEEHLRSEEHLLRQAKALSPLSKDATPLGSAE